MWIRSGVGMSSSDVAHGQFLGQVRDGPEKLAELLVLEQRLVAQKPEHEPLLPLEQVLELVEVARADIDLGVMGVERRLGGSVVRLGPVLARG